MNRSTESVNPRSRDIDLKSVPEILAIINAEDRTVADAVKQVLPEAARLVETIVEKLSAGGRLFYVGAGTSGRIGVMDAAECPPTYGVSCETVVAIIAGGAPAMMRAQETAEDDAESGKSEISAHEISAADIVVGLSASGRTAFVAGALAEARRRGAATAAVLCNDRGCVTKDADLVIALPTGPEVISGSTRMKAATAQKMVLNMVSTAAMIRLGKVTGNFMTSMNPGNRKLRDRARFIVGNITGIPEQEAEMLLERNQYNIRMAVDEFRRKAVLK